MDAEQRIQKTLDGKSDASASVLRPNVEGLFCFKLIPLTQGKFAMVDAKNYKWLNQYKWYALKIRNTYYAVRNIGKWPKRTLLLMHRQILGLKQDDGKQTDHQNRCGLDNREVNLRLCTGNQNQGNRKSQGGVSKFKGVRWHNNKWVASIGKKRIHIGYYKSEIDAAKAYDKKAKEFFGEEFAYTNF